jgi:hypothetical protein
MISSNSSTRSEKQITGSFRAVVGRQLTLIVIIPMVVAVVSRPSEPWMAALHLWSQVIAVPCLIRFEMNHENSFSLSFTNHLSMKILP